MDLVVKKVNRKLKEYKDIKELMKKVFPKNELIPFSFLTLKSKRKNVEFNSYYDNNKLIGISYLIISNNLIFILYLGVNPSSQSKGYGSKILEDIKNKYSNKEITLNIETLDINSNNYNERLKRLKFYSKNGFNPTKYILKDDIDYLILSTSNNFNKEEYLKILKKYSLGFFAPKIEIKDNE